AWADEHLPAHIRSGITRTIGWRQDSDFSLTDCESWQQLTAQWPESWRPEYVLVLLERTAIPNWLWTAPVPLVVLAIEHDCMWHHHRACLQTADLIFADALGRRL